jgi:hypothetical protein
MIIALLDMLEFASAQIPDSSIRRLIWHVKRGTDYLALCQDQAASQGSGDGPVVHEIPDHLNIVTGDITKAAVVFARASRVLQTDTCSAGYLTRALKAFTWLRTHGPVQQAGFSNYAHGAPTGYTPPNEFMTSDLVMMAWAAVELARAGHPEYKDTAISIVNQIAVRQIPQTAKEGPFYGHFKTYGSSPFSEKAWVHHDFAYDVGQTFPHYMMGIIEMCSLWPNDSHAAQWRQMLHDFAYGYFLPACSANPFSIQPVGYYAYPTNEGLLEFSSIWHGMNGAYGNAAAMAFEFEKYFGDPQFRTIAIGNIQWIAGVNAGVVTGSTAVPYSMVYGVGNRFKGTWTGIPGTVCNGFDAYSQFSLNAPSAANDGPNQFTDEDWIVHGGGWLSALARLNIPRTVSTQTGRSITVTQPRSIRLKIIGGRLRVDVPPTAFWTLDLYSVNGAKISSCMGKGSASIALSGNRSSSANNFVIVCLKTGRQTLVQTISAIRPAYN